MSENGPGRKIPSG